MCVCVEEIELEAGESVNEMKENERTNRDEVIYTHTHSLTLSLTHIHSTLE